MPFEVIFELISSTCTEVDRICDRWMSLVLNDTSPVPPNVYYINHSIAPVIRILMQADRYTKLFRGHRFDVGGSKK